MYVELVSNVSQPCGENCVFGVSIVYAVSEDFESVIEKTVVTYYS